ncbi:MAG: hypothetical protein J6E38_04300, partial [Clostridia bacterium]|nr:hypothetical protein [Clostridia bacterium]
MKKFLSILLAVMMVLSTVSFAAPSLAGVADSAVEAPVVEVPAEETADLAADISEDVDSYGTKILEINFDDLTSLSEAKVKVADAGWINPEFDYTYSYLTEKAAVSFSAWPTYEIKERATGDKYLELAGGTGYAVLLIESGTDRGFQGEDGIYTLTADVYTPDAMSLTTRFTASSSEDTPIQDFSGLNGSGWGTMILQHDPSCYGNGNHATPMTSASQVKTIKFHRNGGTDDKTVGYDNIRLYYKPLTVDVTVKAGDKSVKKTVSTLESVSIASLAEELDLGVLYSVTSAKVGDKTYSYSDSLIFGKDSTVELTVQKADDKYVHSEYGLMIFDIDLENHNIGDDVAASDGSFKVGSYVTPIGEKVMSHPASNWHFNDSGYDIKVMADPTNANNKVLGVTGATSTGYPFLMLTTYSNSAAARYGWIEDNDLIWTVTADIYDTTNDGVTLRFGGKSSISENEGHAKWTTLEDTPT